MESLRAKWRVLGQVFAFLKENKAWWMMPLIAILLLFGMLLVFAEGSAFAPFIYTIF